MISRLPPVGAFLVALSAVSSVSADIYRVIGKGNTIAPLRSSEIAMDAETVLVEPEKRFGGFRVTADFTMRNTTAEPVTCDVAFPFESRGHATNAKESFQVTLGEGAGAVRVSPIELKVRDASVKEPRSLHDFAAALVWSVSWSAGETKLIRISYDMGEPEEYRRFVEGWRLRYIVKTGALWKGPIGRADITIRLTDHPIFSGSFANWPNRRPNTLDPPYSYPGNARWVTNSELTWHFENWIPDEDIWLGEIQWAGFSFESSWGNFISLPAPYAGAIEAYTEALLERIVDRELEPWRDSFPKQAQRDRPMLKALVAEWFYREIFARNGDPFFLEKVTPGVPAPAGSRGSDVHGNYLSWWSDKFPSAYSARGGGWYRPGTGPGPNGTVRLSDLKGFERKNADFLLKYFSP